MNDHDEHAENVVQVTALTRRFGTKTALRDVDLGVPRGKVFGLVGVNGAGKTTIIKHLLGLLRAQSGSVRVFGLDPVADPVGVLSRTGYLSEENDLPGWMRVEELIRYTRAFYPGFDLAFAERLRRDFQLDPRSRVKSLSKGQRARAGLLLAIAFRPDLLVLDEPSSGLDPLVRRDILEAIIRTIADEGRTVLFSSHLLDEVERVSDHVAMIHQGQVLLNAPLEEIKARHRRFTLQFEEARREPPRLTGVTNWAGAGREWTAVGEQADDDLEFAALTLGARIVQRDVPSLDEIFVARLGKQAASLGSEE